MNVEIPFPKKPEKTQEIQKVPLDRPLIDYLRDTGINANEVRTNEWGGDPHVFKNVVISNGLDKFHKELREAYRQMELELYKGNTVRHSQELKRLYKKNFNKKHYVNYVIEDEQIISKMMSDYEIELLKHEGSEKTVSIETMIKKIRNGEPLNISDADLLESFIDLYFNII